jgi:hypothetical protein
MSTDIDLEQKEEIEQEVECECCHAALEKEYIVVTVNGDNICSDCMVTCEHCGDIYCDGDNGISTYRLASNRDFVQLCNGCHDNYYTACNACGYLVPDDDTIGFECTSYCEECFNETFSTCDQCGITFDRDELEYHESSDQMYCNRCYPQNGNIHDYGYEPNLNFISVDLGGNEVIGYYPTPNVMYFGIECEVESKNDTPEEIAEEIGSDRIYCTEDSSLEYGVEIKNHPVSWGWIKKNGHPLKHLQRMYANGSCRILNTCGMHVHSSKEAWTPLQIYRACEFARFNTNWHVRFSGRENGDMHYTPIPENHDVSITISKALEKNDPYLCSRYCWTVSKHTIECRLWKGTCNEKKMMLAVEFVRAIWEWTKSPEFRFTYELVEFEKFVEAKMDEFPNLTEYLWDN